MSGCTCENWSLQDLSLALSDMHKDNKRIVVPMFQRGKRWNENQEKTFIDSLIKGYPVGTMLFYETLEDNKKTYILVDGLQRGNSIKKYMNNPTDFFYDDSISDDFCKEILKTIGIYDNSYYSIIRSLLTTFIKSQKSFKNLQYYSIAKNIVDMFNVDSSYIENIIETINIFFEERQNLYDRVASTIIPVIVYTGDESNLPEIFDRINSKGTPLDQYEVYAAAWPVKEKYYIENDEIINYVIKKYDSFIEDGYSIHGYNREEFRKNKKVNAFEYLFGLSKFLINKYSILGFGRNIADDTVNTLAFELVNACLNDKDNIKVLYKNLRNIDLNEFENAVIKAIEFVDHSVSMITNFKGSSTNKNKKNDSKDSGKIFHSKYQILSMISTTFKEMYNPGNYHCISESWNNIKHILSSNLLKYYVYDIITNYWSEGGTSKIHTAAKPNRYRIDISSRAWMIALDSFYESSMSRSERKNVARVKNKEFVILNCLYLKYFTAMDQLSSVNFDIEYIAPKEQMIKLIDSCNGDGLPISCIANLCYLPDVLKNRKKHEYNLYQNKCYSNDDIKEIEDKYSFTKNEDLEWMDITYQPNDFDVLKEYYSEFCSNRFEKIKEKFCESLGIEYGVDDYTKLNQFKDEVEIGNYNDENKYSYVSKFEKHKNIKLKKITSKLYVNEYDKTGYIFSVSKIYKQSDKDKFWFSYREEPLVKLEGCKKIFIVYVCENEDTMVVLPLSFIKDNLDHLNVSMDNSGITTHWHIVIFRYPNGNITWMNSKPSIEELDINRYLL